MEKAVQFAGRVGVFQPRPGLGDLIWHLPLIRAIAASSPAGRVTLITKATTQAAALLEGDPSIEDLVWFDQNLRNRQDRGRRHSRATGCHGGALGIIRLAATLRRCRLDTCVLLHHSQLLACAMALAGIQRRYGYGYGVQRRWLTQPPFLDAPAPFTEAAEQASAYARAADFQRLPEPAITIQASWSAAARPRLAGMPGPLAVLGIGSHGAARQWGAQRFSSLASVLARGGFTVLLAASDDEAGLADDTRRLTGNHVRCAVGWPLPEMAACLADAELFIGNDSGLMNLRAALGRPAYGLFGASGPLRHSTQIRPIVPPGGPRAGMGAIDVTHVLNVLRADGTLETDHDRAEARSFTSSLFV